MNEEDFETVEAMTIYGGGFVQALAEAARHADWDNLARIKAAWPEYWAQYKSMARMHKEKDENYH